MPGPIPAVRCSASLPPRRRRRCGRLPAGFPAAATLWLLALLLSARPPQGVSAYTVYHYNMPGGVAPPQPQEFLQHPLDYYDTDDADFLSPSNSHIRSGQHKHLGNMTQRCTCAEHTLEDEAQVRQALQRVELRVQTLRNPDAKPHAHASQQNVISRRLLQLNVTQLTDIPPDLTNITQDVSSVTALLAQPLVVQVHWHVIYAGDWGDYNLGWVPVSMLQATVDDMNIRYAGIPMIWNLSSIDYLQNATLWYMTPNSWMETKVKKLMHLGGKRDWNAYSVNLGFDGSTIIGYSGYPWAYASAPWKDGSMISWSVLAGGSFGGYNLGRTATHEAGHWNGLFHTFQGTTCDPTKGGDSIPDTPQESSPAWECPIGRDSCPDQPGLDSIHNFMDYAYDWCQYEFTPDQQQRIINSWFAYRAESAPPPPPKPPKTAQPVMAVPAQPPPPAGFVIASAPPAPTGSGGGALEGRLGQTGTPTALPATTVTTPVTETVAAKKTVLVVKATLAKRSTTVKKVLKTTTKRLKAATKLPVKTTKQLARTKKTVKAATKLPVKTTKQLAKTKKTVKAKKKTAKTKKTTKRKVTTKAKTKKRTLQKHRG